MLVGSNSLGSSHHCFELLHEISLFHFRGIYEGDDVERAIG